MKIIKPYFEFEPLNGEQILRNIELAGRTCWKSEDTNRLGNFEKTKQFVAMIMSKNHESVLEHQSVTVRIICDRGVSHEIVRHRIASYSQESTRYCNYTKDKFNQEITFIAPCFWLLGGEQRNKWEAAMNAAETAYFDLIQNGASPQEARSVLPNSLKTEIVMTCNLREWRHFFKLRTSKAAHPQMREIAIPLLEAFKQQIPVIFDDIGTNNAN